MISVNINLIPSNLPSPIKEEFNRLPAITPNSYGLVFAVRDLYETALKTICLSICYLTDQNGDDSFCSVLFSPKQMAFGDWVNGLPAKLGEVSYVKNHQELRRYLKKIVAFYNSSQIVKWRNDFIGHGLMANQEDSAFFTDVEGKIKQLIQFFQTNALPANIQQLDFEHMGPFMFREGAEFYLYESVLPNGAVCYTNQTTRRRISRQVTYVTEKRRKYFDTLNITQNQQVWNQEIYLSDDDKAIDGFHLTTYYKKPVYMLNWLNQCIADNPGGIFLMLGGRGTGKSSFVLACDELNQHGEQKIRLKYDDTVLSVRAYYCNRIDFSNINDFESYVEDILRQQPDGTWIKNRSGRSASAEKDLWALLQFYRQQYLAFSGREKLLFFIDGIDELTSRGWDILHFLPDPGQIPEGVYVVLTCRSEMEEVPPLVQDFIHSYPFTGRIDFQRNAENHQLFLEILEEQFQVSSDVGARVAKAFDHRLSVLPLLMTLSGEEVQDLVAEETAANSLDTLASNYLDRIKLRYGTCYYKEFVRFLMTISEAKEGLSLNEISLLSSAHETTIQELCFLKDAAPFLMEYRSYRGNLYGLSRTEYRDFLRKIYKAEFVELLLEWQSCLAQLNFDEPLTLSEAYNDILLYLCAHWGEFQEEYKRDLNGLAINRSTDDGRHFLQNMYRLCSQTGIVGQVHRSSRVLRGLTSVELSLELLISAGIYNDKDIFLLLECASDMIECAVNLREMALASELINRLSAFIEEKHLTAANVEQRLLFAKFYARCMIYYCEIYDADKAEYYFNKAITILGDAADYGTLQEHYEQVQDALWHNYLGVYRNYAPEKTLQLAEKFMKNVQKQQLSFSKVNNYLMAAMCYKSASNAQQSEALLREACDMMEEILEVRQMSYVDMTNPHEQELYMNVYWRLAQSINETCKANLAAVSFAELKLSIRILDNFINAVVLASLNGFGHFDSLRLDMMTTAALLRNALAFKLFNSPLKNVSLATSGIMGVPDYREEALRAAAIVEQAYENLQEAGIAYNKINAMANLMNCACVYSGFGENSLAVQKLEMILRRFQPENAQEQMVYCAMQGKLEEIRHVMKACCS